MRHAMKRRFLLAASALGLSTTGTRAQRSGRVWRIGYLSGNSPPDPTMASFRLGCNASAGPKAGTTRFSCGSLIFSTNASLP